jgi:pimeloyl-ACP methyl ester carboxylesterase/1-acyl-sn-glycerol-3-phosphate acyltransferase
MRFFGNTIPLLFAAPSALRTNTYPYSTSSITSLRSTVEKAEINDPSPPRKIIDDVNSIYRDLAEGCFVIKSTSTISFQYTSPPSSRSSFKEIISIETSDDNDEGEIYEKIRSTHDNTKPLLLYLPGLDGVGISATQQFDDLSNTFEFWRMSVDQKKDRSSFTELTSAVSNFIYDVAMKQNRKIILVGESFGGLLAPSVALRLKTMAGEENNPVMGMVMVNPATSIDKTNWSSFAPILASLRHIEREEQEGTALSLPTPYSVIGGIALAALIPDSSQYRKIFKIFTDTKVSTADELQDVVDTMRSGFGILADNLPAEVIEHRVGQWLNVGSEVVNPRLHKLNVPTLFIGGDDDKMLPTKKEGDRLVNLMPDCTSMAVKGAGHCILDDRFNLTEAIIDAPFDPFNKKQSEKKYDPITDWKPPTGDALREAIDNRVKPFRTLTSPKFFSTNVDGKRKLGLGQVPTTDGPLIFIANHQLGGLDLGMIIAELLEERGIYARGLAHPVVFQGGNAFGEGAGPTGRPGRITKRNKDGPVDPPPGDFQTFGAVMVTPKNYYRLMATGQAGLLFPGGVREVFHGKDEAYELFWPEKVDFVRVAARFNATIVPISAIGAADSANILLDGPEVLNLPFGLGERAKNSTQNVISARFDQSNSDELFQPPIMVPKLTPARHYFVFGKPFDTSTIHHGDKEACAELYRGVKSELRRGLDDLLEAREKDPFKDFVSRLAVEQLSGKPAPTFPLEELNK